MKVDGRREVRGVAEAAGFALDAHDLAIEPFGDAVGDRVLHEAEHAVEMTLECARDCLDRLEAGPHRPAVPLLEEAGDRGVLPIRPQRAKGFLDRPRPPDLQVQRMKRGKGLRVVLGSPLSTEF